MAMSDENKVMHMSVSQEKPLAQNDACWSAQQFFEQKLRYETDPADVYADMKKETSSFVILDARSRAAYREKHIAGAISMPQNSIDPTSMGAIPTEMRLVTYCWGPGCNGSSKAALKLARLGYRVQEMIGGIEYWEREGLPLVTSE